MVKRQTGGAGGGTRGLTGGAATGLGGAGATLGVPQGGVGGGLPPQAIEQIRRLVEILPPGHPAAMILMRAIS